MSVEVKFQCGHKIGVANIDAGMRMVCPFCAASTPQPEARESIIEECALAIESYAQTVDNSYNRKHFNIEGLLEPYKESAEQVRSLKRSTAQSNEERK